MNSLFDEEAAINQYNYGGEYFYMTMSRDLCTYGFDFDELMPMNFFQQSDHSMHATYESRPLENYQHFQNDRFCDDDMCLNPPHNLLFSFSFGMDMNDPMPIQLRSNVQEPEQTAEQSNGQPASKGDQKRTDLKELNQSIKKTYAKGKQYSEEVNFLNAKRQDILKTAGQLTEEQKSWFKRHKQDLTTKIKANMQLVEQLEKKLNQIDDNEFQFQESDFEEETDDEDDFDHQTDMGRENPKSNIQNMLK